MEKFLDVAIKCLTEGHRWHKVVEPKGHIIGRRTFRAGSGMLVTGYDLTYPYRTSGGYLVTVPPGGVHKHGHHGLRGRNPLRPGYKHTKITRGAAHNAE